MTSIWMPQIDQMKCNGCGTCITQCPTDALGCQNGKASLQHPDLCIYCTVCEDICPTHAITLPFLIIKQHKREETDE